MSDVGYTDDGRPAITVRPRVRDLVDDGMAPGSGINPLEFLYGSPVATGERTTQGPGGALRDIIQSAGRDATRFVTDMATAPYRSIQGQMERQLGEPLSSNDAGLDASMEAAGLVMGGGFASPKPTGALGSAGGRLGVPMKPGPFYSAVEQAIAEAPQAKMTPQEWSGYLRNRPGVKAEELDFMGLENHYSTENWQGPVTKEQMLETVRDHGVKIKEVEKKGTQLDNDSIGERAMQIMDEEHPGLPQNERWDSLYDDALVRADSELRGGEGGGGAATKFHDPNYQLPGGDNYRELLLTMPKKEQRTFDKLSPSEKAKLMDDYDKQFGKGSLESERDLREFHDQYLAKDQGAKADFSSSHWDEPNVLVHMRMNDRQIGDARSLHLEEVQSDWHQQGRKQGYKQPIPEAEKPAAIEKLHGLEAKLNEMYNKRDTAEYSALKVEADTLRNKITGNEGVPDAPFKSTWADLALKRAITKAAEEGYDAVSWTPGAQQAERYDLSKQVDKVQSLRNSDGTYQLSAMSKGQNNAVTMGTSVSEKELANHVGKDLAEKIIAQTPAAPKSGLGSPKVFEGLDLKVGGEGMVKFYDKMLVDKANALGKKFGAKVEWQTLPSEFTVEAPGTVTIGKPQGHANTDHLVGIYEDGKFKANYGKPESIGAKKMWEQWKVYDANGGLRQFANEAEANKFVKDSEVKVPVLRLNDKLRDAANRKGMPLFSSGVPFKFTPVDHDPFTEQEPLR